MKQKAQQAVKAEKRAGFFGDRKASRNVKMQSSRLHDGLNFKRM
jgi:hypothetical protein